jgi:hypothetical protein
MGGWTGPTGGLDAVQKRKIKSLASARNESTIPQMSSLEPSLCTYYVILTLLYPDILV